LGTKSRGFNSISSLHVEANEPPLTLRRQKLPLQYIVKLRSNPNNPAHASVFQPNVKPLFEAKPHTIPTLGLRIHESLTNCGVNLSCVAQHSSPATPPWFLHRPQFEFTLYNLGTKSNTLHDHYLSCYDELVLTYEGYKKLFTDGSKQSGAASAAAVARAYPKDFFGLHIPPPLPSPPLPLLSPCIRGSGGITPGKFFLKCGCA
jgi:hypothetical protein